MEYLWAFLIGGAFCVIGQILLDTTPLTAPRILVIFVVLGVVLQAMHLYEPIVELAGSDGGCAERLLRGDHRTDQSNSSRCGGCDHLWLHDSPAV